MKRRGTEVCGVFRKANDRHVLIYQYIHLFSSIHAHIFMALTALHSDWTRPALTNLTILWQRAQDYSISRNVPHNVVHGTYPYNQHI